MRLVLLVQVVLVMMITPDHLMSVDPINASAQIWLSEAQSMVLMHRQEEAL